MEAKDVLMQQVSKCESCLFHIKNKKCAAFEGEIPEEIFSGTVEHNKIVEGQKTDIVYSSKGLLI